MLRAHSGSLYVYSDGSWVKFSGVIPERVVERITKFYMTIEGLFLEVGKVNPNVDDDQKLLDSINQVFTDSTANNDDELVHALQDAAMYSPHTSASNKDKTKWQAKAYSIFKVVDGMTKALVNGELIKYFVEWCSTEKKVSRGVCYNDCCVLFKEDGTMEFVDKHSSQNIYLYVPHPLLDPYITTAADRVMKFYEQTFVDNGYALFCQFAGESLAVMGYNVERCMWTVGPGGVGQSLATHHLHAKYPDRGEIV